MNVQGSDLDAHALPRGARRVDLGTSLRSAAPAVLQECRAQIQANILAIEVSDHPEGPHQLRVALRRLRGALWIFGACYGEDRSATLAEEARWLGRAVSPLRDYDVLIGEIVGPLGLERPSEPGFARLKSALAKRAIEERRMLRTLLASRRAAALIQTIKDAEDAGAHVKSGMKALTKLAKSRLAARWSHCKRRAKAWGGDNTEARHALRRSLRKLRYEIAFLAPLFDRKRVVPLKRRLKDVQLTLGNLNDTAMAEARLTGPDAPLPGDPEVQRAIGFVLGRLSAAPETEGDPKRFWRELKSQPKFWH